MFIYFLGNFFKTALKKRTALIWFIEITSILTHAKTQHNLVKPHQVCHSKVLICHLNNKLSFYILKLSLFDLLIK